MIRINPQTSSRRKPEGSGFELFVWYFMRISGVGLFVLALAHFSILHFIFDPSNETSTFIIDQRWRFLYWRVFDWLLLMMVLFHSFMGVRTVMNDYIHALRARLISLSVLYLLAAVLFVTGTSVVLTLPVPGAN